MCSVVRDLSSAMHARLREHNAQPTVGGLILLVIEAPEQILSMWAREKRRQGGWTRSRTAAVAKWQDAKSKSIRRSQTAASAYCSGHFMFFFRIYARAPRPERAPGSTLTAGSSGGDTLTVL